MHTRSQRIDWDLHQVVAAHREDYDEGKFPVVESLEESEGDPANRHTRHFAFARLSCSGCESRAGWRAT
jgi:hypothetical protein